ncbi:unnamed protein product, partial [Pylaiella littoralis]
YILRSICGAAKKLTTHSFILVRMTGISTFSVSTGSLGVNLFLACDIYIRCTCVFVSITFVLGTPVYTFGYEMGAPAGVCVCVCVSVCFRSIFILGRREEVTRIYIFSFTHLLRACLFCLSAFDPERRIQPSLPVSNVTVSRGMCLCSRDIYTVHTCAVFELGAINLTRREC